MATPSQELSFAPAELTVEQRQTIQEFFDKNPDGGYKLACRTAGIRRITSAEAKELVESDPELAGYKQELLGLDSNTLAWHLGQIVTNPDHRDQLRAIQFAASWLHGYGAKVEHEHSIDDGHVEVVVEHDYGRLLDKLADYGIIQRGPRPAVEAASQRLLPPPAE